MTDSPAGIIAVLAAVTSFFFYLEKKTQWKFFNYFPPLIFIYLVPVALSNSGIIPTKAPVYDFMGSNLLPFFLVIMLLKVDLLATVRIMGKGVFVMLAGTLGVVIGAPIGLLLVKHGLGPEAWKGFAALAGSWIGGTGNMLSVGYAFDLDESSLEFGYAVIADNAVYLIWLPIMLASKNISEWFNKFTKVSSDRMDKMAAAADKLSLDKGKVEMRHLLYLIFIGFSVTALSSWTSDFLPPLPASKPLGAVEVNLATIEQPAVGSQITFALSLDSSGNEIVHAETVELNADNSKTYYEIRDIENLPEAVVSLTEPLFLSVTQNNQRLLVAKVGESDLVRPLSIVYTKPYITRNTYKILIVTMFGILLSFTGASRIPGSHALAMALVYLFVARMGAKADLSNLDSSVFWFLLGAYVWIFIHGAFLVGAAKLFRVDVHTAAIASAANIGGAASAPIVAAYHRTALVPVSILMALLGYAIGNPAAILAGMLCRWVM